MGSGQNMAFACLIAPSLVNLDDVFTQQQHGKSKSTPQMPNDIVDLLGDPRSALLARHEHSQWNLVLIIAGFNSHAECMQFVAEWKLGRKLIPRLIRGIQLAISRNNNAAATGPKLASCFPSYSTDSIQRIVSSSKHQGDPLGSINRSSC